VAGPLLHARLASAAVTVGLETARHEWQSAADRVEAARDDPRRYARLLEQVEIVHDELRRRVGQIFTLEELARAYDEAERWARELVEERAPGPGWPRDLTDVLGAAFHRYQRGAVDYEP
jgi:hypothetical protein